MDLKENMIFNIQETLDNIEVILKKIEYTLDNLQTNRGK